MEERFQTIDSYQKQLSDLQESWDTVENMQEELEALQEKTEEGLKQYELLGMTKNLLEQAKSSFTAKYTEPVCRGSGNIKDAHGNGMRKLSDGCQYQIKGD